MIRLNELAAAIGDDPNFAATVAGLVSTERDARIAAIVGVLGAPESSFVLNTLKRLSDAVGDDPNFSVNLLARLGGIDNTITTETNARLNAVFIEQTARVDADNILSGQITREVQDRIAAIRQEQLDRNTAILAEIARVIDAAPGMLDTLNELAAAIGDDPNFASTVAGLVATERDARIAAIVAVLGAPANTFVLNDVKRLSDAIGDDLISLSNLASRLGGIDNTIVTAGIIAGLKIAAVGDRLADVGGGDVQSFAQLPEGVRRIFAPFLTPDGGLLAGFDPRSALAGGGGAAHPRGTDDQGRSARYRRVDNPGFPVQMTDADGYPLLAMDAARRWLLAGLRLPGGEISGGGTSAPWSLTDPDGYAFAAVCR